MNALIAQHSQVCRLLSVVCHIRALCLNCSTALDAIAQVHLRGPITHCVTRGLWPHRGRGDMGIKPGPPAKTRNCWLQPNRQVLCCHLANTNKQLSGLATAIPRYATLHWSLFMVSRQSAILSHAVLLPIFDEYETAVSRSILICQCVNYFIRRLQMFQVYKLFQNY